MTAGLPQVHADHVAVWAKGVDLPVPCSKCPAPARYATTLGLLCRTCRDLAYPSDGIPAG